MKRFVFIAITVLLVACAGDKSESDTVRNMAVEEVKSKLNLPEGTTFNNENIEVTEKTSDTEGVETIYMVKVSIKSQDQNGNEVIKTHTLEYEKGDGDTYKLVSFNE